MSVGSKKRPEVAPALTARIVADPGQKTDVQVQSDFKILLSFSLSIMKPITWFAPMWAFMCGAIAGGMDWGRWENLGKLFLGIFLSGPILCGLSQVLNDWFDREVDAINEPNRPIPSGRVTGVHVFGTTIALSVLGVAIPMFLGEPVMILAALGFVLALTYSVHPIRAKRNGWIGNALVAISYEGLPWLAGNSTFGPNNNASWTAISVLSLAAASFYSLGSHGIMTINDFKSVSGDILMKINTIPVLYGPKAAAWIAVVIMNIAQIAIISILFFSGKGLNAGIVFVMMLAQFPLQAKFLADPKGKAIWYNTTGTMLYVYGMLVTAIGIGVN